MKSPRSCQLNSKDHDAIAKRQNPKLIVSSISVDHDTKRPNRSSTTMASLNLRVLFYSGETLGRIDEFTPMQNAVTNNIKPLIAAGL